MDFVGSSFFVIFDEIYADAGICGLPAFTKKFKLLHEISYNLR